MNAIEKFTVETVDAISKLVKENLYTQALIILYSAIDTLAWASLPSGDVKQKDFIAWVDKYITPESKFGCTADDLYGARCGLVHSNAAESRKSRKGESREIWYATSPYSINLLREYARQRNDSAKIICFTDLLAAFVDASQKFFDEISIDEIRQRSVDERICRWLKFVPVSTVTEKTS
jgi:hypothetical protein